MGEGKILPEGDGGEKEGFDEMHFDV